MSHTSVSLMTGCPRGWSLITDGMVPGLPTLHYSCDGAQQSRPGPTGSGVNCQVPAPASAPWPGEPEQPPLTTGHWVMVQPVAPLPSSPSLGAQQLSPGRGGSHGHPDTISGHHLSSECQPQCKYYVCKASRLMTNPH